MNTTMPITRFVGADLDYLIAGGNISPADHTMLADRFSPQAGVSMPLSKTLSRIIDKGVCYTVRNDSGEIVAIFGAMPLQQDYPSELQLLWEGIVILNNTVFERNPNKAIAIMAGGLLLAFDNNRTGITLCTQIREDFATGMEKYGVTVHRDKKYVVNGVNYVYCSVNKLSVERLRAYLYPQQQEVSDVRDVSDTGTESSDGSVGTPTDQEEGQQGDISDQRTGSLAATVNQDGSVESGSGDAASAIPIADARG